MTIRTVRPLNPKEAIEFLKKQIQVRQQLDGLDFWGQYMEATDGSGKRRVLLVSEQVEKDLAPTIKEVYNFVIRSGSWMRTLLHHIEHLESANSDLWNELQKGKGDG